VPQMPKFSLKGANHLKELCQYRLKQDKQAKNGQFIRD